MKKTIVLRVVSTLLLLGWLTVIYVLSAEPAEVSAETSGGVTEAVLSVLVPDFASRPAEEQAEWIALWQKPIRKTAHFTEYAILGLLAFFCASAFSLPPRLRPPLSVGFCALCAALDEAHQGQIPGRSPQLTDVLLDTFGALCGVLAVFLLTRLFFKKKM